MSFLKKYPWVVHTALPLAVVVLVDYIALIGRALQILCTMYLCTQVVAAVAGFCVGVVLVLKPDSPWDKFFSLKLTRVFPLVEGGRRLCSYLLSEVEP